MTKPKTLEQLRAEKERAETQLAQEQHKLERLENYEYTPQKEKIPGRGEGLGSLSSAKLLEFKQKIPTAKATVGMIKSDCTS